MATRLDELPRAMAILVDLHQRRRKTLGEKGCFASARFAGFYRDVVPELLRRGRVQLYWLEFDGRPAAAEYHLAGDGVLYVYQSGMEPELLEHKPGNLINLMIVRQAIERGYRAYDFLRGDEPYKARFGAQPRPSVELRIVPPRAAAHSAPQSLAGGEKRQKVDDRNDQGTRRQGDRETRRPGGREPGRQRTHWQSNFSLSPCLLVSRSSEIRPLIPISAMPPWKQFLLTLYYHATYPARARTHARLAAADRLPAIVLCWHRIADDGTNPWTVSNAAFARQIRWLSRHFQFVSLDEAQRRIGARPETEPEKGTVPICRNGPKGASHKWGLSPFPVGRASASPSTTATPTTAARPSPC